MLFAHSELKRMCYPYVPSQKLAHGAEVTTEYVRYKPPYAHYHYKGMLMVSPNTESSWAKYGERKVYASPPKELNFVNPLGSKEWDKRAMENGGKQHLARSIAKYTERLR